MGKYLFNLDLIEEDLFILMSILNSSREIHNIMNEYINNDSISTIFYLEWKIIEDKIIASAIRLRAIDDRFSNSNKRYSLPFLEVGTIYEGEIIRSLVFRESCNKIVHALEFTPNIEVNENYSSYKPFITLKGKRGRNVWSADLDMNKYIINGLSLLKQYDEDWAISTRND